LDRGEPTWWNKIDMDGIDRLKDSDFLQTTYSLGEWWKASYLFQFMYTSVEYDEISDYRMAVIEAYMDNPDQFGDRGRQMSSIKGDQIRVRTHMEHFPDENMNFVWTEYFPRIYYNLVSDKMKASLKRKVAGFINFNPESECVFKESNTNKIYVVPKLPRPYLTKQVRLVDKITEIPVFCSHECTEISYILR